MDLDCSENITKVCGIEYTIEKQGDAFVLYSVVNTNSGGSAKNFVRKSNTKKDLEKTISRLNKEMVDKPV